MELYHESKGSQHYVVLVVHRPFSKPYKPDEQDLRTLLSEHLDHIPAGEYETELYEKQGFLKRTWDFLFGNCFFAYLIFAEPKSKQELVPRRDRFLREGKIHYHAYRSEDLSLVEKVLEECRTETGIQPQQDIEYEVKEAFQINQLPSEPTP